MKKVILYLGIFLVLALPSLALANQACHWRCWQYPDKRVYCWCYPLQGNYYHQRQARYYYPKAQTRRPSYPERIVKDVFDNAVRTAVSELNWAISDAIRSAFRK